jgi:flavin reductase (DIM6/NTAB) family NADH-FMN oxidoreductase RutF
MRSTSLHENVDSDKFRRTLGRFLTGVTVVTTTDRASRRWGMTANSFTSVSLDPPLVSVCISKRAGSYKAFCESSSFAISILSEFQEDVARKFASPRDDKFEDLELLDADLRAPVVDGCTAWLVCDTYRQIDAGDHVLLLGRVEVCDSSPHAPLGYCEGNFLALTAEARGEVPAAQTAGREIVAGWLVEQGDKVALVNESHEGTIVWSLPMGPLTSGRTMSEALNISGKCVLGCAVEPTFLYSVIDLSETHTCHVYRAQLLDHLEESPRLRLFRKQDIPWAGISDRSVITILKRYFSEKATDRFGVYLNVGQGKIAQITGEQVWDPTAWE